MSFAFTFPGQGSQSVGMLASLSEDYPAVEAVFERASQTLGFDLWALVQEGPEEQLNRTEVTQPAMLTAGVAVWQVWRDRGGPMPAAMAGHSLGEYTALVCAESLDFEAAVTLVAERGRFMQEAVPEGEGAIAAVLGLDDSAIDSVCRDAADGLVVSPVNFNAPGQVAIAGHAAAVERAMALAKDAGARRTVRLPLSVPVHCELMSPATERLRERLAQTEIRAPLVPVMNNVDGECREDSDDLRDVLARQLYSPVQWVQCVRALVARGVDLLVECGPGRVLTGLNKRIDREIAAISMHDPKSVGEACERLEVRS